MEILDLKKAQECLNTIIKDAADKSGIKIQEIEHRMNASDYGYVEDGVIVLRYMVRIPYAIKETKK